MEKFFKCFGEEAEEKDDEGELGRLPEELRSAFRAAW
jgi:hypothetical protein